MPLVCKTQKPKYTQNLKSSSKAKLSSTMAPCTCTRIKHWFLMKFPGRNESEGRGRERIPPPPPILLLVSISSNHDRTAGGPLTIGSLVLAILVNVLKVLESLN